jgi:isoleucyl-tRNA synthetase
MFKEVPQNASFPALELEVLELWKNHGTYEKSLKQRVGADKFVFFEGPPTANGMPHPGHCLTRAIKDLFPRYQTMRGYLCQRKAGWDTHGLPVEVEVCKELCIHSKEEIEEFGVEPFIHKCQQSVWRYMRQWEQMTERLGFWVNLDQAYVTYHQSYIESVWWSLKNLFDRGLLYQGHKIVWWWSQGGTALSAGEVGQGYRQVADPSVYVRFPLVEDENTSILVWTTTPWTLPNNQFVAVHPQLEYSTVVDEKSGTKLIVASAVLESLAAKFKTTFAVQSTCQGTDLVGKRYRPPFDYYYQSDGDAQGELVDGGKQHLAWRMIGANFVTTDSGTGVVHEAPAFGEVDYAVLMDQRQRFVDDDSPPLICAVGPDGKFTAEAPDYEGLWVKDADREITRTLRDRELLYHQEQYLHDYPFCWRAEEDPLIQYPRESWFIRTTEFKDELLANNAKINWLPSHIRDGRFGNFLESNVDWALSRERFWGTPLPIWVCEETGYQEAVGSYDELLAKPGITGTEIWEEARQANPELPEDLKVHKPYIDAVTYDSPKVDGKRMRRVTEVIDCWYDSGAMPFAQWGFREGAAQSVVDQFRDQFPADFISEAIDQTRGWFYSLLAISTLLFGKSKDHHDNVTQEYPHPFRNCIVLGLMLGEDGQKMSKSKRNYREPNEIFEKYGADALRWYFFANQPPWTSIRYSERAIKDSIPEFLLRLWNVYSFFVIYANIDGFDPSEEMEGAVGNLDPQVLCKAPTYTPVANRSELDRWMLSELNQAIGRTIDLMDAYDNYGACAEITAVVDALSNWYVRRSRERFWSADKTDPSKRDAYWTLYECLLTLSRLVAPFTPFLAESLWQNLSGVFAGRATESVHLTDYPDSSKDVVDALLSSRMQLLREIASLGRSARMNAKLKVRQPLSAVEVILAEDAHRDWLLQHDALLRDELNVKKVEYTQDAETYISYEVVPNFKRLGPRVGRLMPAVKKRLETSDGGELLAELEANKKIAIDVEGQTIELSEEDVEVRLQAKQGWAAAQGQTCVVVLSTELTDELICEGFARDLVRFIQDQRKQLGCEYTDRIQVGVETSDTELQAAIASYHDYVATETLSAELVFETLDRVEAVELSMGDRPLKLYVRRLEGSER